MFATDPANLQLRVRPLLRLAEELVREFPPQTSNRRKSTTSPILLKLLGEPEPNIKSEKQWVIRQMRRLRDV